jgi:hypothetical protein
MARSTLNFFTRLFSFKKKKILEKRDDKKFINEYERSKNEEIGTLTQNLGDTSSQYSEPVIKKNESVETKDRIHESISDIENESSGNVYVPYDSRNKPAHDHVENANTAVSTEKYSRQKARNNVEMSDGSDKKQYINQEYSVVNTQGTSDNSSRDDSLEYDSMVLLSKLEQLMIRISDSTVQKSIPLVIEALVEMANYVVEFAGQLPGLEQKKGSLRELLERDEQNYKILNPNYIDNERLGIEISAVTDCANPQRIFIDLSNDLLRLINVYLSASVKVFKSDQISEQWKTLYTGFFVNLTKSVRSSQANQQS